MSRYANGTPESGPAASRAGVHAHTCVACGFRWAHGNGPIAAYPGLEPNLAVFKAKHTCPRCGAYQGDSVPMEQLAGIEISVPPAQLQQIKKGAEMGLAAFAGITVLGAVFTYAAARAGARRGCR